MHVVPLLNRFLSVDVFSVSTDQGSDTGRLTPQSRRPTPEREVEILLCSYLFLHELVFV